MELADLVFEELVEELVDDITDIIWINNTLNKK